MTQGWRVRLSGAAAGAVNGLFGGGGGMVLLPLLDRWCGRDAKTAFASCTAVVLPMCLVSAAVCAARGAVPWGQALPYLIGGLLGGLAGGRLLPRVSAVWLRRLFAGFLLYGAWRYLC